MEYDIYHDESHECGYWHGILLVPRKTRMILLGYLDVIREEMKYSHFISLKGLKEKGRRYDCLRMWTELGGYALIQNLKGRIPKIYCKEKIYSKHEGRRATRYKELLKIDKPIKAKFILFRERDSHKKMESSWFFDHASKIETTFRMGLKGGVHFLFNEAEPAHIKSVHFDGYEHHKRAVDRERIVDRIQKGLREYCRIDGNTLIDDRTGNHTKPYSQGYEDCQFLQLTDLLVGAFRTVLGEEKNLIQRDVSFPAEDIVERWNKGYARMQNSRWFRGVCISECYLDDGQWHFQNITRENERENNQLKLF